MIRALALTVTALAAVFTVAGVTLLALTARDALPLGLHPEEIVGFVLLQIALSTVGLLLTWRLPGNLVGWLLTVAGLFCAGQFLFAGYAMYGSWSGVLPYASTAAWLFSWSSLALGATAMSIPGLFPSGRLRSAWARAALIFLAGGFSVGMIALALRPGPLTELSVFRNPYGWAEGAHIVEGALAFGTGSVVVAIMLMFKHLAVVWRGAVGIERQQLKWLIWSVAVFMVTALLAIPWLIGPPTGTGSDASARFVARVAVALAMTTVPVAIGFAVLRHRLYDIDVLINRTLVYGAVTAVLAGTYFGAVVLIQGLLRPFTSGSELAVAASTLLVVALFQPIRRRVQDLVDRRFYRSRYDAARTLDAFSARLRGDVELESVRADLIGVVAATVRPAHTSLWLR